jgi:hypothetical protein
MWEEVLEKVEQNKKVSWGMDSNSSRVIRAFHFEMK